MFKTESKASITGTIAAITLVSGCAQIETTYHKTAEFAKSHKGVVVGAVSGSLVGALACEGEAKCIAAAAIAGGALGHLWDLREKKLKQLAREQNIVLDTKRINTYNNAGQDNGLEIAVKNTGMFRSGSSELNQSAEIKFKAIASVYKDSPQNILIMGHTDATGQEGMNQILSEQRAQTVARLFEKEGISSQYIYYQGSGESQPIADNSTPEGRATNRRVEILEIDSEDSMIAYSLTKKTNPNLLSHSTKSEKEINSRSVSKSSKPKNTFARSKPTIDFGGGPASPDSTELFATIGIDKEKASGLSLFNKAHASSSQQLLPCYLDNYRSSGDIKNLNTGKKLEDYSKYTTADFYNGLYRTSWSQDVNGHLVAIQDLAILRNSGESVGSTKIVIHKGWYDGRKNDTPDYELPLKVNTYMGKNGVLVRSYYHGKINSPPILCTDIFMQKKHNQGAVGGNLYYGSPANTFSVEYAPTKI